MRKNFRNIGDKMDVSAKYYKKAVEYYNEGYLEKALFYCEKSISNSLKSSAAVNLKGLLLYLKGQLSEAEALWKLNYDYNKDQVAKKYLENLSADWECMELYKEAQRAIAEMDFKGALTMLERCSRSDVNAIGVNNALCTVFIHMGRYEEAKQCIEKVRLIDRNDKVCRENANLLIEYRIIKGKNKKKLAIAVVSILALVVFAYSAVSPLREDKKPKVAILEENNSAVNEEIVKIDNTEQVPGEAKGEVPTEVVEQTQENSGPAEETKETFPKEAFNDAISNRDYEEIIRLLAATKQIDYENSEKELYIKAQNLMKAEGVSYFYKKGRALHIDNKYSEALEQYISVEKYAEGDHLYEHIIYMLGDCYQFLKQRDKAIEYYNKYLSLSSNSGYNDTVLYQLVLIYKDNDINLAKKYAKEITEKHKKSIYNNSVVQAVIKDR